MAIPVAIGFSFTSLDLETSCSAPRNLALVSTTSTSASFDWDDAGGGVQFKTYWVKLGTTSQTYTTSNSNYTHTNLSPGTYDFYFYTDCGGTQSSLIVIEEVLIG